MKKQLLGIVFVLVVLCGVMATTAMAETVSYAVTNGNLYFDTDTGTITDCDTSVTRADIPSEIQGVSVRSIGEEAFQDCIDLMWLTIPESVTTIGRAAFKNCQWLISAAIPEGVTSIEDEVFYGCKVLKTVSIPRSVASISQTAFQHDSLYYLYHVYYAGSESEWDSLWQSAASGPGTVIINVSGSGQTAELAEQKESEGEDRYFCGGLLHFNSSAPEEMLYDVYSIWNTVESNGHHYSVFPAHYVMERGGPTVSFWRAERFCELQGGHLAALTSGEENKFVSDYASHIASTSYIYFGLYYSWTDDEWKWVTGEPMEYTAWWTGDPEVPVDGGYGRYRINRFSNRLVQSTRWENARFLLMEWDTGNSVIVCEWDDTEGNDLVATDLNQSTADGEMTITGTLGILKQDALILCAAYNKSGQMLPTESTRIDAGSEDRDFSLTLKAEAESVKMFVLDADTWEPLCPAWKSIE